MTKGQEAFADALAYAIRLAFPLEQCFGGTYDHGIRNLIRELAERAADEMALDGDDRQKFVSRARGDA